MNTYTLLMGTQTIPASVDVSTEGSQEIGDRSSTPARFDPPLPPMGVCFPEVLAGRFHRGAPALTNCRTWSHPLCPVTEKWMRETETHNRVVSAIKNEATFTGKWMQ